MGVDVFFAISGFVITSLLIAELGASGDLDLSRFYSRGARRLLPGLAAMVTVVLSLIEDGPGGPSVADPEGSKDVLSGPFSSIRRENP